MQFSEYERRNWLAGVRKHFLRAAIFLAICTGSIASAQEAAKAEPTPATTSSCAEENDQLRKSIQKLTAEVSRLRAENAKLEKYRQVDYLRDLLVKEENRVLASQKELSEISDKESALQKRLDEIDAQLRPGRIEQSRAGVGSTKPEEDRAEIEKQLSSEKRRIQIQLDQFQQNRRRLQSVISSAESSIGMLRQRLSEAVRALGVRN